MLDETFVNLLGKSLFTAIIPDFNPSHGTHIICSVLDFQAKDGKASSTALVIDGKHVVVGGGGAIELASGKIDFVLLPTAKDMTLAPLVTPVHLAGTITDPQVMDDVADVLKSTGHLLLGIVNPLSLATPILHPNRSGDMPCRDPGAFAGGQQSPVERAGQGAVDAVEGVGHGIGSAIEHLGKGASDLLRRHHGALTRRASPATRWPGLLGGLRRSARSGASRRDRAAGCRAAPPAARERPGPARGARTAGARAPSRPSR